MYLYTVMVTAGPGFAMGFLVALLMTVSILGVASAVFGNTKRERLFDLLVAIIAGGALWYIFEVGMK